MLARLACVAICFSFASAAFAQFPEGKPKAKDRPKYEKRGLAVPDEEELAKKVPLFPPWGTPSFYWTLHPVIGLRLENDSTPTTNTTSSTTEIGGRFAMQGIPLAPGNPGLYIKPHTGYTLGTTNIREEVAGPPKTTTTTDASFSRFWYGSDLILFVKFYRHTLGVTKGTIDYNGDLKHNFNSLNILNDFGVLILPFLSAHLTLDFLTAYEDRYSEPQIKERDHWLHGRAQFDFLSMFLDLGPGFTNVELYQKNATTGKWEQAANGDTNYFLALGGLHLFWKLGLSARLKYVYDAPVFSTLASELANTQLPTKNVSDAQNLSTLPEDSLDSTVFLGARGIFGGLGLGYNYHVLILNYNEKNGAKRETYRDQGMMVTYDVAF